VCLLLDALAPDRIVASPVHVGAGHVRCAHGVLPVPAPATAEILKGIPIYGGAVDGELCTPTGAALVRQFVTAFCEMPVMTVERVGYGMGKKEFERANCVRAILGESADRTDEVVELSFNVDDMTAEEIGFATEMLFASGANEVFTVPVGMKKNRPGTLICVLCEPGRKDEIVRTVFKHTTTIGVRESAVKRTVLDRAVTTVETPYGAVSKKTSQGCGVTRTKFEYDDLARVAKENGLSLREARKALEDADK
ncbi:MAG: LarC family nickel insertion protein, partial [Clostridia bacterium]|nr:LarC family nickel insertion protein [Clostridia bacterium]